MTYHEWGDDFDWNSLDLASYYIWKNCRRYARLGVWTKEKYGTLRISLTCAYFTEYGPIFHFFYPGYVSYRWPKKFWKYIDHPIGRVLEKLRILYWVRRYQHWVLRKVWLKAADKWPHIKDEILFEYGDYKW